MFKKQSNSETTLQWKLSNGSKAIFLCGRVLGKGAFGKCYQLIQKNTGNRYACKVIDKQSLQYKQTKEKVQSQVAVHRKMQHPNIVKLQRYHQDDNFVYLLLQLCSNNTLEDVLHRRKQLTQMEVRYYMRQILQGTKYIHQQKVVHRDLKLQNFFISEQMSVKIGDFGLATSLSLQKRRKSICGTPNYMAPQIFKNKDGYSFEVDIWSLGIIAFIMLVGRFPFQSNEINNTIVQVKNKVYLNKLNISQSAQSFITNFIQINPSERLAITEILRHQFLTSYDIPPSLPLSCLICEPTFSFASKYKKQKVLIESIQEQKFQFMLQSKQSQRNKESPKIHLQYMQIDSIRKSQEQNTNQKFLDPYVYKECLIQNIQQKWINNFWQISCEGLMYQTNCDQFGMRFFDGSNIKTYDQNRTKFTYITQKGRYIIYDFNNPLKKIEEIDKKIKIFISLIQGKIFLGSQKTNQPLYIRLYYNTLKVFLIWLSNGLLQGKFLDGTELIIGVQNCLYIGYDKSKIQFCSQNLSVQAVQIIQKFRQIQEVIKRITKTKRKLNQINNKQNINNSHIVGKTKQSQKL